MTVRFVRTVCPRDCYDTCTLKVEVENERIVSVKGENAHPVTKGFLCPRGTADGKRAYSERRVLKPQIRVGDKPTDTFREATWSEALDIIIEKLEKTLQKHGRETVLHLDYAGTMGLLSRSYAQRLWNALGAASHDASICSKSGHAGIGLHYGRTYGVQPDMLPELELIVFWGFNARVSSPHMWAQAEKARQEKGAIIVAVDPRRSPTAEAADIWLNPKPGSDIALTYGLAHILIEKGWVDTDFVEEWCQGYSEYREEAANWGRERVEETTGLNWMDIESLARLYHERKSSATMIGIGLQKSTQGADMVRAVSLIPPLLGLHRGFYYSNGQGNYVDGGIVTGSSLKDKDRTTFSQVALGEVLERGDIKFLWVNSMNPAVTIPNQNAVRKGLSLPLHCHRPGAHGSGKGRPLHPHRQPEDQRHR